MCKAQSSGTGRRGCPTLDIPCTFLGNRRNLSLNANRERARVGAYRRNSDRLPATRWGTRLRIRGLLSCMKFLFQLHEPRIPFSVLGLLLKLVHLMLDVIRPN